MNATFKEQLENAVKKVKAFDAPFDKDNPDNQPEIESITLSLGKIISLAKLEAVLAYYQKQRDTLVNGFIPKLMEEEGLSEIKMADGTKVKVEVSWNTSTKDCDKSLLAEWLEENGLGDLIKDSLEFGKGQINESVVAELRERGLEFSRKSDVNATSLKAALKKHMEAGGDLPPDEAVHVSIFNRAVVK